MVYHGSFESWSDVCSYFEIEVAEPDEVLYAIYDQPPYEGYADVVYRIGERFYWVHGSHCSCYGLEGQWDPEEYSAEQLVEMLRRGNRFWYADNSDAVRDDVLERIISSASYHCGYYG